MDPDADPAPFCASCGFGLHGACTGWVDFCSCECGLGGPRDPLLIPAQPRGAPVTGFYMLDHPSPHGPHYYRDRRGTVLAAVIHITAGLQGRPTGADSSAEQTARYAATTDRKVSWHSGSDRDSHLRLLPDEYTAWHCEGYNSRTIGHEISKRDVSWADEDPVWVTETLEVAAACLRPRLVELGIPIKRATRAQLDQAIATNGKPVGLIGHDVLDPDRRRDPGDFPWTRFLRLLAAPQQEDIVTPSEIEAVANRVVEKLKPILFRQAQFLAGQENSVFNASKTSVGLPAPKADQ